MWLYHHFTLYYKALAQQFCNWPKPADNMLSLTGLKTKWMLSGYGFASIKGQKILLYEPVFADLNALMFLFYIPSTTYPLNRLIQTVTKPTAKLQHLRP
jgi:hypothetical protein